MKKIIKNPYFIQFSQFLTSTFFAMGLQLVFLSLLARHTTVEIVGTYRFMINSIVLLQVLGIFGYANTISYMIADHKNSELENRIIIGNGIRRGMHILIPIIILGSILILVLNQFNLGLLTNQWILFLYLSIFNILIYYFDFICIGLNDITLLSLRKALLQILFILLLLPPIFLNMQIDIIYLYATFVIANLIVLGYSIYKIKPIFKIDQKVTNEIITENKKVGIPMYLGSIMSTASNKLVTVVVLGYVTLSVYGEFSSAIMLATPLTLLISSTGNIFYKKFRNENYISYKIQKTLLLVVAVIGLGYVLLIKYVIIILLGQQYVNSIFFAQVLGISCLITGLGDVYNRFLSSKGEGKAIKNAAMTSGLVNIISAVFLLPTYNVYGALVSFVLASITYLSVLYFYYIKFTKKHNEVK